MVWSSVPDLAVRLLLARTHTPQCQSNGSSAEYQTLKAAVCERHLKQKVALAVDLFNKDGKKGLIALQVGGWMR